MAKGYSDLSRRALIQLNEDFDQENNSSLLQFLTENEEDYENVRPIESIVERCDQVKESICDTGGNMLKQFAIKQADSLLDKIISTVGGIVDGI